MVANSFSLGFVHRTLIERIEIKVELPYVDAPGSGNISSAEDGFNSSGR
jgi:hypothetical protein